MILRLLSTLDYLVGIDDSMEDINIKFLKRFFLGRLGVSEIRLVFR